MAPTMTLDTISKIRMVLAVWLMVMRIARWAVFSVQMSFESFRIGILAGTLSPLKYSSTKLPQASSRLLPTCPKLSSTIPMLVSKNPTTFLVITSTTSLHCSSLSFSFSSRSTRLMRKNLALVSKHEIVRSNSHSRLEARDRETETLDLASKHETERKKFLISSRSMRLKGKKSRSRLET